MCLEAGLNVEGINAEVAAGQWEFQIFAKSAARAGDEIWLARYLLERTAEKYDLAVDWHPKPLGDTDWNGSGMHANFSNGAMREKGEEAVFTKICEEFAKNIPACIAVYGAHNDQRLTGKHETQSIDQYSYGVSDRGAPSASPSAPWRTAGRVAWKIAARHPTPIRTRWRPSSSRSPRRPSPELKATPDRDGAGRATAPASSPSATPILSFGSPAAARRPNRSAVHGVLHPWMLADRRRSS
jgi:hypothetical protein